MRQYSFTSTNLVVNSIIGSETIDGFADVNQIITAMRLAPQHGHVMDAKGKMSVATSADKSGIITFSLLQTSDSNRFMLRTAIQDQEDGLIGNGRTFRPIRADLTDLYGGTKVIGRGGYIP